MGLTNNKRGKGKYSSDYSIRDAYRFYRQEGGSLKYKLFVSIYELFIQNAMYHILEQAADFRMFARLGDISIRKRKIKKYLDEEGNLKQRFRKPNWKKTLELWERKYNTLDREVLKKIEGKPLVYHNNEHTGGYTFYIDWDRRTSNVKNQSKYVFIAARDFARAVNKIQNKKKVDYYEYPELRKHKTHN